MGKFIDYLTQYGDTVAGPSPSPATFTVDIAQLYVEATYDVTPFDPCEHYLQDGDENYRFHNYDSFYLIAVGVVFPLGFQPYSPSFKAAIEFNYDNEGVLRSDPLPGIGEGEGLIIPFANFEVPIGIMYNPLNLGAFGQLQIGAKITELDGSPLKVSMIGVDDSLDGEEFNISLFAKILHNDQLTK